MVWVMPQALLVPLSSSSSSSSSSFLTSLFIPGVTLCIPKNRFPPPFKTSSSLPAAYCLASRRDSPGFKADSRSRHPTEEEEEEKEEVSECSNDAAKTTWEQVSGSPLLPSSLVAASIFVDLPAFARPEFGDDWLQVLITWGVVAILYFIVVPLIVFNYLRLRWYKRKLLEAYFHFLLVFLFFPGLLLCAPFINFRPLPRDRSKAP